MQTAKPTPCPDCAAPPGALHQTDCDVERCPACGRQYVTCDCPRHHKRRRLAWTGLWPGEAECREFGWFVKLGAGHQPCGPDEPDAMPDLNRLGIEAKWDRRLVRFVRR
jgi:hypothetical protein